MALVPRIDHPSYRNESPTNIRKLIFPKHRDFVRMLPCAVAYRGGCAGVVEFAHVRASRDAGAGRKPSDRYGVPLCHKHHILDQHVRGEAAFWFNTEVPVALAEELYRHTGNGARALRAIERAAIELERLDRARRT